MTISVWTPRPPAPTTPAPTRRATFTDTEPPCKIMYLGENESLAIQTVFATQATDLEQTAAPFSSDPEIRTAVITGNDIMQNMLESLDVTHAHTSLWEDIDALIDQHRHLKMLYVSNNCDAPSPSHVDRIVKFVEAGGQLVTVNKAITDIIEIGFPDMLEYRLRTLGQEDVAIDHRISGLLQPSDPLSGAFSYLDTWRLHDSHMFTVLSPAVQVLMSSTKFQQRIGAGALKARFPWEAGWVTHFVSSMKEQAKLAYDIEHQRVHQQAPAQPAPEPSGDDAPTWGQASPTQVISDPATQVSPISFAGDLADIAGVPIDNDSSDEGNSDT